MEREEILNKLKDEIEKLNNASDKQFKERFSTSKHRDSWQDEIFKEYQTARIRVDLLIEMLS